MKAGMIAERESPFVPRKFDPYLNGQWIGDAVSYGCYREGQAPGVKGPSDTEILEDLIIIKQHWNLIRVYGSDADSERVLHVIKKNKLPIKVMLGIWLENEGKRPERKKENMDQVRKGIALGNDYHDIIAAINVGNETLVYWSGHRMQQKNLIKVKFLRWAKVRLLTMAVCVHWKSKWAIRYCLASIPARPSKLKAKNF